MIEFKEILNAEDEVHRFYQLFINGKPIKNVEVIKRNNVDFNYYQINTNDREIGTLILSYQWTDFPPLEVIRIENWTQWDEFQIIIFINIDDFNGNLDGVINFSVSTNFREWKRSYSFSQYERALLDRWRKVYKKKGSVKPYNEGDVELEFDFPINFENVNLLEKINEFENLLRSCHEEVKKDLITLTKENSLLASFTFPEDIQVPCEQYLIYFAQFLRDLGIKATSNIKEEAGKILFSVTPTNNDEALDKICEALAVYLNLPASPIVYDESFAAMRLQQQVENLQHSQKTAVREIRLAERELRLAQTVIEQQDKIIIQKDSIVEQQNKVIEKIQSKSIMMDSLENKEEFEKVFDGLEFGESKELKEKLGLDLIL